MKLGLKSGLLRATVLKPWKIGKRIVVLGGYDNERPTDSLHYKDMVVYYEGKLRIRPSVLHRRIRLHQGELYSLKKQTETQTALSKLGALRYTELRFFPQDTLRSCDTLNLLIHAPYDYPLNGELAVEATNNNNNYVGPGATLSMTRQNLFGGGETFTAAVRASYEWQTGKRLESHTGVINNYEFGVNGTLSIPRLLLPRIGRNTYDFSASTQIRLSASQLNRARFYRMLSFSGGLSYEFDPSPIRHHSFTPLRLTFNK